MSFVVSGKLTVDGGQAKAELAATAAETRKLGGAAGELDQSARQAAQGTRALEAAAAAAATDIRAQAQAAAVAEAQNEGLARSSTLAAGSVGNLAANFNDVFVMMAAGQNPMQLAIQQGTQITQVLGPMGAAGAVRALGAGLMAMLSPMNLFFIGGLAGAAALTQSLMGAGDEVVTLDGAIDELGQSIEDYQGFVRLAATDTSELREEFGEFAGQVQGFAEYMAGVSLGQAMDDLRSSITPIKAELSDVERAMRDVAMAREAVASAQFQLDAGFGNPEQLLRAQETLAMFEDNAAGMAASLGLTVDQAAQLASAIDLLGSSQSMSMADIATQAGAALTVIQQIAAEGYELPPPLRATADALEEMQRKAAEAANETERTRALEIASIAELLAQYQEEAELKRLINEHGSNSAEVATFRVQAERDALIATLDSLDASAQMRDAILAAFDAANGVASVNMAGNIALAANEAGRLAQNMALVEGIRRDQARRPGVIFDPRDPRFDPVAAEAARIASEPDRNRTQASLTLGTSGSGTSGASRGGAAAARTEADAVERLIERKQQELELLRVTDPVQREMIRNRELLATATQAQRDKIDEVTAALEREKAVQQASDFFASSASDFLSSIVTGSASASDALDGLIQKLIDAGIQALLLGEGPLAGILGISGGIFGGLFGGGGGGGGGTGAFGLPMPFAEGGMIYGKGGPTDDKELILASPGEFVTNARATAKNRALLEYLNAGGEVPGFARGGAIGGGSGGGDGVAVLGGGPLLSMPISIDARGAQRGVGEEIEAKLRQLMPEIENRAVAAVARAQRRGKSL